MRIDLDNPGQPLVQYVMSEDDTGAGIWATPAIDAITNTVFVTTGNGVADVDRGAFSSALLALDATTLERKAHFFAPVDFDADLDWGGSPTLFTSADGTELVAAAGKFGYLYALRRSDLTVAWTLRLAVGCVAPELGCGSIFTPAFDGHTLYTGAGVDDPEGFDSGSVYAIEPSTGAVIWKRSVTGTVLAPVTVVDRLVFASTTRGLEVFDAETGESLWNDPRRGTFYSQPVIVDGVVYTTYVSGAVVAWRPDNTGIE